MPAGESRTLILLRHAKSAWPEGTPDHERPLGRRGLRDAPMAGRWLRLTDCSPDYVLCSTALRARQTWQLAESELGARPPVRFESRLYEASAATLLDLIRRLPPTARAVMVIGHDPAVPDVACMLSASSAQAAGAHPASSPGLSALSRMTRKFPTAAMAVLKITRSWHAIDAECAQLAAFVTPRDFANISAPP